ncbi:DNase I-like protein, partial [Macroventuria anomochaeta]
PHGSLLLGDFNTHHPWWEPQCLAVSPGADSFVEWIESQHLELLNTPGTGTFFRSNMSRESVLDLSFVSQDLASRVEDWQVLPSIGSDHHGILFAI